MALVPHKITALAESDADGTDGKNIVAGAVVSLFDTTGAAVTLFDDEAGNNGSTAKQTDSSGQVVVWVTAGEYSESVNGSTQRAVTIGGRTVTSYPNTESLQNSRPTQTGQRAENRERANAQYELAASGYAALPGDIAAANGRVWALLKDGANWLVENFESVNDALSRASVGDIVEFYNPINLTSDLEIPTGVTLKGSYTSPDEIINDWDYNQSNSRLSLSPTATIRLSSNATISDCVIINSDLSALPFTSETQALTAISSFSGTAITANGAGVKASNLLILGFEFAITSYNFERVTCEFVRGDCTNGIHIERCFDVAYLTECHFWPFLTVHQTPTLSTATYTRAGTAFKMSEVADWSKISDCFSYGYYRGVNVLNANNVVVENTGCDNITIADTEETIGFLINGTSRDTKLIGCQTANQEHGYYINTSQGLATTLTSCDAWVTETSGVLIQAGDVSVNGGRIRNGANGVNIINASSKVIVSGVMFNSLSVMPINCSVPNTNIKVGINDYGEFPSGSRPVSINSQLSTIASADPLPLSPNHDTFKVSGTTNFGSISGGFSGREITMIFEDALTVNDGPNIQLTANFTSSTDSLLRLIYNGSKWIEVSRSVN